MDNNEIARLAFRHEGQNWNAYIAESSTMENAILIGSLNIDIAEHDDCKQAFMDCMAFIFKKFLAVVVDMEAEQLAMKEPRRAPEHERSGHS